MTLFGCDNTLNIASTNYVDCVVTTVSGHLQEQIDNHSHGVVYTDFSEAVVSGTTSRTNVISYTIPANTLLASNRPLRITSSYLVFQGAGSSPQYLYFHGSFDSTDVMFIQPHAEFGTHSCKIVNTIYPKTNSSQKLLSDGIIAGWGDDQGTEDSTSSTVLDNRDTSFDMTSAINFELDLELSTAHAGFFVIRNGIIIETF